MNGYVRNLLLFLLCFSGSAHAQERLDSATLSGFIAKVKEYEQALGEIVIRFEQGNPSKSDDYPALLGRGVPRGVVLHPVRVHIETLGLFLQRDYMVYLDSSFGGFRYQLFRQSPESESEAYGRKK
jgi:hypothetical protein